MTSAWRIVIMSVEFKWRTEELSTQEVPGRRGCSGSSQYDGDGEEGHDTLAGARPAGGRSHSLVTSFHLQDGPHLTSWVGNTNPELLLGVAK